MVILSTGAVFDMMYEVVLTDEAIDFLEATSPMIAKKVTRCFATLEQHPYYHPNIKSLKGNFAGFYRFRIGEYRVIFEVDENIKQVRVINIAHRSEVYDA